MSEKTWNYVTPPISNVPAPYIEIVIKNLERSRRYPKKGILTAMVDTGYDGYLITPHHIFHELKLESFEIPPDLIEVTETFTGERLEIRTSLGIIEVPDLLEKQIEIDTHENCTEPLLGRLFLENILTTLDGPNHKTRVSIPK